MEVALEELLYETSNVLYVNLLVFGVNTIGESCLILEEKNRYIYMFRTSSYSG